MTEVSFNDIVDSVTDLSESTRDQSNDPAQKAIIQHQEQIRNTVERLKSLPEIDHQSLVNLVAEDPYSVPILASCIGLTQERLKNQLKHRLGTSGWIKISRSEPEKLIQVLDDAFDLVRKVSEDSSRQWSFADVLLERYQWSRRTAGSAIRRGRELENEVEQVVKSLGLSYEMRSSFTGRGGNRVPCDLAIPSAEDALIVGAAKGYNSTGSKLTDAVREIEEMARYRLARQFVFAFIDGIGWKNRLHDLKRIFDLWKQSEIDGLYTLANLDRFKSDLVQSAVRHGLLSPESLS